MGGAESMTAVSKQRKWYVHKKKQAVQKDSLTQPCLGPFDHELKTSKLSHAVLVGRRETALKIGEMKSSQRNVRLEFAHDDGVMPCIYETYVTSRISMVMHRRRSMAWTSLRDDFCITSIQCWVRTKQRHRNPCTELHLSVHRYNILLQL